MGAGRAVRAPGVIAGEGEKTERDYRDYRDYRDDRDDSENREDITTGGNAHPMDC